jgi:hypothetical protein
MRAVTNRMLWLLPALVAGPLAAQAPLTLGQALQRAERSAYANRIAAGQSAAQAGQALAPYRGILPTLRVESGYLRTTDPLNAFGFTLRQRAVTPAAFAPARLNDPNATGNLMTGVVVEQPIFNADAWLGRAAAANASKATLAAERWTRSGTAGRRAQPGSGAHPAHRPRRRTFSCPAGGVHGYPGIGDAFGRAACLRQVG